MSLPSNVIDRLFERLIGTYGRDFTTKYDAADINTVKSVWAHELDGFGKHLKSIAWALENLPERAPNVIQFRNLARMAPAEDVLRIDAPAADPARLAEELAKLGSIKEKVLSTEYDPKAWARRILGRHDAGEKARPISLLFAQQALNCVPVRVA